VYYKSLDPARQMTSVTFGMGVDDGTEDAITASQCPPGIPHGPLQDGWMYRAGYEQAFWPYPCACDGSCRGRAPKDAPFIIEGTEK
jgi:hypothetical protein